MTPPAKTVSAAVAEKATGEGPGTLIAAYETDFARVLPGHVKPETFVRLSQGLLRRDDNLRAAAQRNPWSLLSALLDCARLGHEPGTEAYYLVPFKDKRNDTTDIVGIEGYRGQIERMYRAGAVKSVTAEVVRANDRFSRATGFGLHPRPHHEPAYYAVNPPGSHRHPWFASDEERGGLVGVYAYAVLEDGSLSRVVTMSRDEVMRHKAAAQGSGSQHSPWNGPFESAMWLKTAVHELEKWVPTSSEYLTERIRAAAEASRVTDAQPELQPVTGAVDGEVVTDEQPQPESEVVS